MTGPLSARPTRRQILGSLGALTVGAALLARPGRTDVTARPLDDGVAELGAAYLASPQGRSETERSLRDALPSGWEVGDMAALESACLEDAGRGDLVVVGGGWAVPVTAARGAALGTLVLPPAR